MAIQATEIKKTPAAAVNPLPSWLGAMIVFLLFAPSVTGLLVWAVPPRAAGDAADVALEAASNLYAGGEFDLAAQVYGQVAQQGVGGAPVLYNQGLAALNAGQTQAAKTALLAAAQVAPRDEQIALALEKAETALSDASGGEPRVEQGRRILAWLRPAELEWAALLLWSAIAAGICLALLSRRRSLRALGLVGSIFGTLLLIPTLVALTV
jgi:tetratricopeptide (TPR) repeat protein